MSAKGNEILLRARQQFQNSRQPQNLRAIDVPEWGTKVYYWPAMSVEESRAVGEFLRVKGGELHLSVGSTVDCCIANLMHRARDEGGSLLFCEADERALRADVDTEVVQRVGMAMGLTQGSVEDAEKN